MKTDLILAGKQFKHNNPSARIHIEPCRSSRIRELIKDTNTCIRRIRRVNSSNFPMQVFYYA